MILAAQGIAGGVDGGAAGGAKGQARIVGGQQEVVEQREAALRPLLGDGLIAPDDHLNGLIAKELGVGGGLGGQGGLHRVDQGVDGAGGEHLERQALQQLGDQHRVVGVHGGADQAKLGSYAGAGHDGDIGHLAARAAGGGDDDQLPLLFQIGGLVIKVVHPLAVRDGQHLGDVDHRAAADGDHPLTAGLGRVGQDRIHHHVGGLPGAILLLEDHIAVQVLHTAEVGLIDIGVAEDQVVSVEAERLGKLFAGVEAVQSRLPDHFQHSNVPFSISERDRISPASPPGHTRPKSIYRATVSTQPSVVRPMLVTKK